MNTSFEINQEIKDMDKKEKYYYYYEIGKYTARYHTYSKDSDNISGWDPFSWRLSGLFKEITKEQYERIVEIDKEIVERMNQTFGESFRFVTWHNPIKQTKKKPKKDIY